MKQLASSISFALVLIFLSCFVRPIAAQTALFHIGDSVEVHDGGEWVSGIVTGDLHAGTYVVNSGSMIMHVIEGPANIRAHQMTPAEQAEANKSAKALATMPKGNGVGAQYGAREPATCTSRKAAPGNASIAKQYLLCDMEGLDGFQKLMLYTDVTVQVAAPRAFLYRQDSIRTHIDVRAPVYDLRGAFKEYQCSKPILGGGAYTATHNCNLYEQPQATGSCYRDTFGDWHCLMVGSRVASASHAGEQMPPR